VQRKQVNQLHFQSFNAKISPLKDEYMTFFIEKSTKVNSSKTAEIELFMLINNVSFLDYFIKIKFYKNEQLIKKINFFITKKNFTFPKFLKEIIYHDDYNLLTVTFYRIY